MKQILPNSGYIMPETNEEDHFGREASRGENIGSDDKLYITQMTQLFLCGTSSWGINRISYNRNPIAFGTFTFLLGHGLLGLLKYTVSESNKNKIRPVHGYSSFLTRILPLPLISTEIYLEYDYSNLIAYSHAASILLPFGAHIKTTSADILDPIINLVTLANAASIAYVCYLNENYWALGFSIVACLNELAIDYVLDAVTSVSPVDLWTSALGVFALLAIKTLESV